MVFVEIGMRVIRGPDWKWGNQDGGLGHVGTVVEVGRPGSSTTPDKTVVVVWDSGSRTNYRTGYQNAYDLRLIDNAPIGVKHSTHICDGCRQQGILGVKWSCSQCHDFDLCTSCYMSDKHDINHIFIRFNSLGSAGVSVGSRKSLQKVILQGIFVGAKVTRGPDWDWGNQDGGEGKFGRVIEVRGWDGESGRSVASVTWTGSGSTNVYRLGHKGKIDLKYIHPATSGSVYLESLPVLGKIEVPVPGHIEQSNLVQGNGLTLTQGNHNHNVPFNVGEQVRIIVPLEQLKIMQEGHGGWNHRMQEFLGKVGVVHRITDKGDVRVQYSGSPSRWTIHPGALAKVHSYIPGDVVLISDDISKVVENQKGHGEWMDYMRPDVAASFTNMSFETKEESEVVCHMVQESAHGDLQSLKQIIIKNPDKINCKSGGKTCLQVACHQGHLDIVRLLLDQKASLEIIDDDGDTALHYASFGNQPEILELLLKKGAAIDITNKSSCSALHVAVNKQFVSCVKLLLKYNCDVNIQDSYGDTALHDAISKESLEIVEMLGNSPRLDLTLSNNRGFNVLHHSALKGNSFAAEKLVRRARQYVDVCKEDGFAALHLAALNGHRQVVEILINVGQATIDLANKKKQTPLLLAASQGHCSVIELLVGLGANIAIHDEDEDTALHLTLLRRSINPPEFPSDAPRISMILSELAPHSFENSMSLAVACFLLEKGADISACNKTGKRPLDFLTDPKAIDVLQSFAPPADLSNDARMDMEFRAFDLAADSLRLETQNILADSISPAHKISVKDDNTRIKSKDIHLAQCIICVDAIATVTFQKCKHLVTCEECARRTKRCLVCKEIIESKVLPDGRILPSSQLRYPSADRMQYLESKISEIEEANCCNICMERRKSVVFLCGHAACAVCADTLKTCHMCRKTITKKINLY